MKSIGAIVLGIAIGSLAGVVGCSNGEGAEEETAKSESTATEVASGTTADQGRPLFFNATFSGNGRACGTCHSETTGTINPAEVTARFKKGATSDKLFRHDGADTLGGNTFERIKKHATVIVDIPLPANVSIVGSPARSVQLNRGVPSTKNVGLDPVIMFDGREPNLQAQAAGAIRGHAQSSNFSTNQLDAIAAFEKTLFSSTALKQLAAGGPAPQLPAGNTDAEKRGRVFFVDDFVQTQNGTNFRCVHCHNGPMLNETSPAFEFITTQALGFTVPKGTRFFNIAVAEFNTPANPVREYDFKLPDGTTKRVAIADPGRALVTGSPADIGAFKIPTLWGASKTAPYFHNNGAKTIFEMVKHYQAFANFLPPGTQITDDHVADIAAYMSLL